MNTQTKSLALANDSLIPILLGENAEVVSEDRISQMRRVVYEGISYYLKCYYESGKHLRKYLGRSRARAEYENLCLFQSLAIPTPTLVSFIERRRGLSREAFLLTEGLEGVESLLSLQQKDAAFFNDPRQLHHVMKQIADYTRRLHHIGFVHVDLKWRNILVHPETLAVYFIDCPQGHQTNLQRRRGVIKDLACLDKVACYALSPKSRLRFYKMYHQINQLTQSHKTQIKKILHFFKGRE